MHPPLKEGPLQKKGGHLGGRRNWTKRFFTLTPERLIYAKKRSGGGGDAGGGGGGGNNSNEQGSLSLGSVEWVRVSQRKPHLFQVSCNRWRSKGREVNEGRVWEFLAGSDGERDEWINAISAACELIKGEGGESGGSGAGPSGDLAPVEADKGGRRSEANPKISNHGFVLIVSPPPPDEFRAPDASYSSHSSDDEDRDEDDEDGDNDDNNGDKQEKVEPEKQDT